MLLRVSSTLPPSPEPSQPTGVESNRSFIVSWVSEYLTFNTFRERNYIVSGSAGIVKTRLETRFIASLQEICNNDATGLDIIYPRPPSGGFPEFDKAVFGC